MNKVKEFSKWRSIFWPIYGFELKKVLPMFLMFFLISFDYSVLRNLKDALIVTAPNSGAETILFLKFWGTLPCAILFTLLFAKLSNILRKQTLFYAVIAPFLIFFALFGFVFYPLREYLHPNALADYLQSVLPQGFMGLIAMLRNWTYALFYIMAELWGGFLLSLMFWGFANDITKVGEAKRFYPLFGIGANMALLVAGFAVVAITKACGGWDLSLQLFMSCVLLAGLGIVALYWWMNKYVLTDSRFYEGTEQVTKKKEKPKMSLKESFLYLVRSPYMGLLSILVIGYGICINIVEVTWKNQLKLQFPEAGDYTAFMGYFSALTGVVTVLMLLFASGNVIRKFGWKKAAMVTPLALLITGVIFFALVLFKQNLLGLVAMLGTSPLMLAVIVGSMQNIISKSCKYSLFDPTKEMAYIPLDQEQKVKGKAAIDVVGARLGKSGGSLLQQGLLLALGSMAAITPYLGLILFLVILCWIIAVSKLGRRFQALSATA